MHDYKNKKMVDFSECIYCTHKLVSDPLYIWKTDEKGEKKLQFVASSYTIHCTGIRQ